MKQYEIDATTRLRLGDSPRSIRLPRSQQACATGDGAEAGHTRRSPLILPQHRAGELEPFAFTWRDLKLGLGIILVILGAGRLLHWWVTPPRLYPVECVATARGYECAWLPGAFEFPGEKVPLP